MPERPLNVAVVGLGTVGTGVARVLIEHSRRLERRAGRPICLRHAVVRDLKKPMGVVLAPSVLTDDLHLLKIGRAHV